MSQVLEALDKANGIRSRTREVREKIKNGTADPAQIVRVTDLPIRVGHVLMAIPGIGPTKAEKLARRVGLHLDKRIGSGHNRPGLTTVQRERFAQEIEGLR